MSKYKKGPAKPAPVVHAGNRPVAKAGASYRRSYAVEPVDTWFFRESRPHAAIGGQELPSLFPPPARSTWGMLAHMLGRDAQVDWQRYRQFRRGGAALAGGGDELATIESVHLAHGRLQLNHMALVACGLRWYAAPAGLLLTDPGDQWLRLAPTAQPVPTDLGDVFLPTLQGTGNPAAAAPGNTWFSADALSRFLAGDELAGLQQWEPDARLGVGHWAKGGDLFGIEPRLGIALQANRKAKDAMLYQTGHLRAAPGTGLQLAMEATLEDAQGARPAQGTAALPTGGLTWFGSEGRPAALWADPVPMAQPEPPKALHEAQGRHHVLVYFATAADFSHYEPVVMARDARQPQANRPPRSSFELRGLAPSWADGYRQDAKTWQVTLGSTSMELLCVASPRPAREGGWSLSDERPTDMASLVPAGTCWYCVTTDPKGALALHGKQLGDDQHLGRGQVFIGTWKPNN